MPERLTSLPRRAPLFSSPRWSVLMGALLVTAQTNAESWRVTPTLATTATATNNSNFEESRDGDSDLILDVAPRVQVIGEGGNYKLDADFGVHSLLYTGGTRPNDTLPDGQLKFRSTMVDRWVYFDANARVAQTAENPFLGNSNGVASSGNQLTTVNYDLAPSINHDFTPTLNATARSQWGWSKRENLRDIDAQAHQVRVSQRTIPLGWALDLSNERTHFEGEDEDALVTSAVRATGVYSPDTRWKAGLIVGRERTEFDGSTDNDKIIGLSLEGAPTDRTLASVIAERRFFGTGWNLSLRHRSPFMSLSAQWIRRPTAQGNTLDVANATTTAQLLDSMLITRHPDPAERAELVQDMLSRLSLPSRMGSAIEITADTPQLEQSSRLSAVFQGRLNTVTFGAYLTKLTPLHRDEGSDTPPTIDSLSTRQHGFSVDFNRRLNELTTADLYLEINRLRRLSSESPDAVRDRVLRLSLTRQLDPKSAAFVSIRRRLRDMTLTGSPPSVDETGLVVGLSHRF